MLTYNKQKEKVHKEKYQLSRTDPRKSGSKTDDFFNIKGKK